MGMMLIQCDKGILFLRPERQRLRIALLGVNQLGCKLRRPSVEEQWDEGWAPIPHLLNFL